LKRLVPGFARCIDRLLERGELAGELRETVRTKQPLRSRSTRAPRHESIPAPHHAVASDEALADREPLPFVTIGNGNLP
jgi:hypothetical protein